jgi:hypothetical protein
MRFWSQKKAAVFDAFISYSHAADGVLAAALQQGFASVRETLFKLRAIRAFRDETTLAMTPRLRLAAESIGQLRECRRGVDGARQAPGSAGCLPAKLGNLSTRGKPNTRVTGRKVSSCREGVAGVDFEETTKDASEAINWVGHWPIATPKMA